VNISILRGMPPIVTGPAAAAQRQQGDRVISVRLGADALTDATFALSPLAQMVFLLGLGGTIAGTEQPRERPGVRETLFRKDLRLLAALRREIRGYAPGFLLPQREPHGALDGELHRLAATPDGEVARQVDRVLTLARAAQAAQPSEGVTTIAAALDAGEQSFVQRLASELETFWREFMAERWEGLRCRMEADIRHRGASMASRGLSATLNSLHPAVSYDSGVLHIRDERSRKVFEWSRMVLHPSPLASTWLLRDDPWGDGGTHLVYPVGTSGPSGGAPAAGPAAEGELGKVIGEARLLLLSDLGSSRTTTELAERHRMSASTVSYHLLRLHRVGLLNRVREGSRVYYQRTPEADRLVARRHRRTLTAQFAGV
jgi:DNA-binding transcriptional ArsR family regulator